MGIVMVIFEILIAGLQAFIWFSVFLFAFFGNGPIDLNMFQGGGLITLIMIALAYSLGILVDRVADTIFSPLDHKLRRRVIPEKDAPVREMRLYLMSIDDGTSKVLEYMRSRLRTARATALNVVMIFGSLVVYRLLKQGAFFDAITLFEFLITIVVVAVCYFAWQRITKAYYLRLAQAYHIVVGHSPVGASEQ